MDVVLLIGHGSLDADGSEEFRRFAELLGERLAVAVEACFLELADPPIVDGIQACVGRGASRIIALPLFLGAATHQKNDVPALLNWARARHPDVQFRYGTPLGAQYPLVAALAERANEAAGSFSPPSRGDTEDSAGKPFRSNCTNGRAAEHETAILLVGRGSRDPDSNSEVARMARLLAEGRGYGWVESAFYSLTGPDVASGIERCVRLGARRVVVLPYLLFTGRICRLIGEQGHKLQARYPEVEIIIGEHLGCHDGVIEAAQQRYEEVLAGTAAMTCDLCKYRQRMTGFEHEHSLPQQSDHNHGMRGVHHHHHGPIALQSTILPPRYRGNAAVSAAPMGAAELVFDAQGQVAWDQIWGKDDPDSPFCELALAGGPPHRGELLEPVTPEAVQADHEGYARVLTELLRGVQQTTGLKGILSRSPGWLGVECDNEEMAIWLLRAIIVENISVRREGKVLYLPVGPQFRLEYEIKNVITALAKTHHYWREHVRDDGAMTR